MCDVDDLFAFRGLSVNLVHTSTRIRRREIKPLRRGEWCCNVCSSINSMFTWAMSRTKCANAHVKYRYPMWEREGERRQKTSWPQLKIANKFSKLGLCSFCCCCKCNATANAHSDRQTRVYTTTFHPLLPWLLSAYLPFSVAPYLFAPVASSRHEHHDTHWMRLGCSWLFTWIESRITHLSNRNVFQLAFETVSRQPRLFEINILILTEFERFDDSGDSGFH